MSKERQPCQIIENAKTKANDIGLDPREVKCPADHVCVGTCCLFDGEPCPDMGMIEKFNRRKAKREGKIIEGEVNKK